MAKRAMWFLVLGLVLMLAVASLPTQAAGGLNVFVDCIDRSSGEAHVWFGYSANEAGKDPTFGYIDNGMGVYVTTVTAGTHHRVADAVIDFENEILFSISATFSNGIEYKEVRVNRDTRGPSCSNATGQPDGGLKTVSKDVALGCYRWEKLDEYNHWGDTGATTCSQVEGDRVFVRLVLGPDNPDTNPDDYRVSAAESQQEQQ